MPKKKTRERGKVKEEEERDPVLCIKNIGKRLQFS